MKKTAIFGGAIIFGLQSSDAFPTGRFERERHCTATPLSDNMLERVCHRRYIRRLRRLPDCEEASDGEICEGSGECGTDNRLNNCKRFDLYKKGGSHDTDDDEEGEHDEEDTGSDEDEEEEEHTDSDEENEEEGQNEEEEEEEEEKEEDEEEEEGEEEEGENGGEGSLSPPTGFKWPLYDQQCRDDAGPVFSDDQPGWKYYGTSQAAAVLQDGSCPDPLKEACDGHQSALSAYLEGPLQCGGKGWFCRILPDASWDGGDQSDWNYNHCNRTDYGDSDGHCHGSDSDDTYYWWVRDHWHRNYAGRLHCCCDWGATAGVVSRCDYRAPLAPGENRRCRDANEDHNGPGSGFSKGYEAGCDNLGTRDPLPEPPEGQCWDVLRFAPGADADR